MSVVAAILQGPNGAIVLTGGLHPGKRTYKTLLEKHPSCKLTTCSAVYRATRKAATNRVSYVPVGSLQYCTQV